MIEWFPKDLDPNRLGVDGHEWFYSMISNERSHGVPYLKGNYVIAGYSALDIVYSLIHEA